MRRSFKLAIGIVVTLLLLLAIVVPYVTSLRDPNAPLARLAFAVHDPNALSFDASLTQTAVSQGQTLTITVGERNKLLVTDDLPLVAHWTVQNLSMGPCNFVARYPFGIALYQGRYTVDNVSMAKSVMIYAPGAYFCPLALFEDSFRLGPLQSVQRSVDLTGYWTEGLTYHPGGGVSEGILHPFVPGLYTLAAGDLWGHFVLRYFTVID